MNAISLLMKDHKDVKALFAQYQGLSDRSFATKKKLAEQICHQLTVHTQLEEEIFYPAVRRPIHDGDLMDEAVVEHASAKELIAQILAMDPTEDLYDAKLTVLSEQIQHHVKEEEGDMFPKVRKTGLDLDALGEQMAARKQQLAAAGT
ncbi:hemerythrin domain-containing protein [Janthinobacterium sp. PC23-8]|uniref:hemerythrin domain-containing protein n=1 Tax=Janthinobacterium sp. PC23-8 TaxID=2012679 RepID=UPI000B96CB46|nr:hemerythrin domain-containing protein [Janthinobacterium sp. PC23-8]OYO28680.1 hemerythrin [Janthinobacterium sp. PC23-8]